MVKSKPFNIVRHDSLVRRVPKILKNNSLTFHKMLVILPQSDKRNFLFGKKFHYSKINPEANICIELRQIVFII